MENLKIKVCYYVTKTVQISKLSKSTYQVKTQTTYHRKHYIYPIILINEKNSSIKTVSGKHNYTHLQEEQLNQSDSKQKDEQIQLRESSNHDSKQTEFKSKNIKQIIEELYINEDVKSRQIMFKRHRVKPVSSKMK